MDFPSSIRAIHALKKLPRSGWVLDEVKDPEHVADHCFGTALLTLALCQGRKLNLNKAVQMALIHDLGEALIGDVLVDWKLQDRPGASRFLGAQRHRHGMTGAEKHRREGAAWDRIAAMFGPAGRKLRVLWREYETGRTPEARFVRDIDKLDMAFQALAYERQERKRLPQYFRDAGAHISDPQLRKILTRLLVIELRKRSSTPHSTSKKLLHT